MASAEQLHSRVGSCTLLSVRARRAEREIKYHQEALRRNSGENSGNSEVTTKKEYPEFPPTDRLLIALDEMTLMEEFAEGLRFNAETAKVFNEKVGQDISDETLLSDLHLDSIFALTSDQFSDTRNRIPDSFKKTYTKTINGLTRSNMQTVGDFRRDIRASVRNVGEGSLKFMKEAFRPAPPPETPTI